MAEGSVLPEAVTPSGDAGEGREGSSSSPMAHAVDGMSSSDLGSDSSDTVRVDFGVFLLEGFELEGDLGRGTCAVVRRASCTDTGRSVAVKQAILESEDDLELARKEYALNLRMSSRSDKIVPVRAFREGEGEVAMVFDLMEGGSLDKLPEGTLPLREEDARQVVCNLFQALAAMHTEGIAHCDVKLANLMMQTPGDFSSVLLGDLGLGHDFHKQSWITTQNGTPKYAAPEIVRTFFDRDAVYGAQVDIWAGGVVAYQLLCGHEPFTARNVFRLFSDILSVDPGFKEEAWQSVSAEAADFVKSALCKDKDRRMTAKQALFHPWLAELAGEDPNTSRGALNKPAEKLNKWLCFKMDGRVRC